MSEPKACLAGVTSSAVAALTVDHWRISPEGSWVRFLSPQLLGLMGSRRCAGYGLRRSGGTQPTDSSNRKRKIVVVGGHPDDPESGCGGTMARLADLGHEVVALYLTRGEAGIAGKSHEEAATIRTAECREACKILKARPVFAGQIDGATEVNPARYDEFRKILEAEKPELVFTHWPIDTHRDHRAHRI